MVGETQPTDGSVAGKRPKSNFARSSKGKSRKRPARRSATGAAERPPKSNRRYSHLRLDETVGFLLADTTRTMTRSFSARIARHGVGMGIFQFLRILWEQEGLTQSELAVRARMRGPSAAGALHDLERRGFVRRIGDRDDGRKVRVHLTQEGRRLYDLVMPDIDANNSVMLAGFSAAEQRALKTMLRRMRRNLAATGKR
jgi:DNA-binding MarR family transcriptional regulator